MSKSVKPSPARSLGAAERPHKPRRTLSAASPARSDTSGKLMSVVEPYINNDKFVLSPIWRRSVLPDDTEIEAPRRASWWRRLEGSSRDVLEALDTNKMQGNLLLEDFEVEVEKEKQSQSVPENSDNDSVASIVVPQRRLFNQKKQPQDKFGEIMGSRKSLGRTNLEDHDNTINYVPKNLFNKGQPRNRPEFPAALLNSTNKTINKTVEPDVNERQGRNLFGQAGTKRKKNMFTDFVLSESEDDSEIQHKVFGFKKNDNKRISLATRNRRMPSLTPSVTTEIDIDDWNLLPSSTMIGNGSGALEASRVTNDDEIEQMEVENRDITLTEAYQSLDVNESNHNTSKNHKKQSLNLSKRSKSNKYDESDKTLTNENIEIEQASKIQNVQLTSESNNVNKSQRHNETKQPENRKNKTLETESSKVDSEGLQENKTLHGKNDELINNINELTTDVEASVEDKMAEIFKEDGNKEKSDHDTENTLEHQRPNSAKETINEKQDDNMDEMIWNDNDDDKANEDDDNNKSIKHDSAYDKTNEHASLESEDRNLDEHAAKSNDDDDNDAEDIENEGGIDQTSENNDYQENVDEHEDQDKLKEDIDELDDNDKNDNYNVTPIKATPEKGQKTVEVSVEEQEIEQENEVVEETPNSSYDTMGRIKKKDKSQVKSPEAVLQNISKDNMSFKPIGRSTSFRKSGIEDINIRPTLVPIQESTIGSDGSRNSSTEGSGWDSHRTTRKTLRQTFGKDFTPRKSLRTLVMEKSAKRQSEVDKNASKVNKTKNKTVLEDQHIRDRRVSNRNISNDQLSHTKSPDLGVSALHVSDPLISKPQLSYHKSVHDINEAEISQEILNREETINISDQARNDSGPEISMHASYGSGMSGDTHQEINEISINKDHQRTANKSMAVKRPSVRVEIDNLEQEELDYDPSVHDSTHSALKTDKSKHNSKQEISAQNNNETKAHEIPEREDSERLSNQEAEIEDSEQEMEADESEQEMEVDEAEEDIDPQESDEEIEAEESQHEIEAEESEQEVEAEESQHEIEAEESEQEVEAEESQHEIEVEESEQEVEAEEFQQDIEPEESEPEEAQESQQEMELESEQDVEQEESQQEIEPESDQEESQQEIEAESDNEQSEQNVSRESVNISQGRSDQESDGDVSDAPDREMDSDHELIDQDSVHLDSRSQKSNRQTERIVFDNEMSDQEIDYELSDRVSRHITENEISEQVSEGVMEEEISVSNRVSDQAETHDVSSGKKSLMRIQMEKIAQENMEMRLKIREKVQNSLKQKQSRGDCDKIMYLMQPITAHRHIKKAEPIKLKKKPKTTTALLMGALPEEFMEDLKYKPPKRFQPANAPWITKRLYKFLESKLEPKYDYRARVRAEQLVENIYGLTKAARRRDAAPPAAVDALKREMARLRVVTTHHDFYHFFHEFMPREIRVKVNPDITNKIPMPRNGVFSDILQARPAVG